MVVGQMHCKFDYWKIAIYNVKGEKPPCGIRWGNVSGILEVRNLVVALVLSSDFHGHSVLYLANILEEVFDSANTQHAEFHIEMASELS